MGYIILWRPNGRDPHISLDAHYFKDEFSTYDAAVEAAEEMKDNEHYRSYAIYEEVTS